MKSRKVKAAAKGKAYMSKKKLKGNLALDVSDSGSNIDSESFFHDDIDDFHKGIDDQLSTDDELIQHKDESSEEEEVLPITDDEKDSDDDQYDRDESDDEADDLPNPEAWGKKKSAYYSADFVDEDRGRTYREEDAEAAKAEAEEAFAIQKSVYSNISADNLGANLFLEGSESSEDEEETEEDIASATKQEKIKFLMKTSPEMFEFLNEFSPSMLEIKDKLAPLLQLARKGKLPSEAHVKYIKLKYRLLLHCALNMSFYMVLKSSGDKTSHHPVLRRIACYKKYLHQLKPIDDAVKKDFGAIMENQTKEDMSSDSQDDLVKKDAAHIRTNGESSRPEENIKIKKPKRKNIETEAERHILSLISDVKQDLKRRKRQVPNDESSDDEPVPNESAPNQDESQLEEKRTISYQIAKNKGLVPHRKKEYRNPRVRHRMKFRKANIRRKGQVREAVKEVKRYEGEATGISTHVVRSIKFK